MLGAAGKEKVWSGRPDAELPSWKSFSGCLVGDEASVREGGREGWRVGCAFVLAPATLALEGGGDEVLPTKLGSGDGMRRSHTFKNICAFSFTIDEVFVLYPFYSIHVSHLWGCFSPRATKTSLTLI